MREGSFFVELHTHLKRRHCRSELIPLARAGGRGVASPHWEGKTWVPGLVPILGGGETSWVPTQAPPTRTNPKQRKAKAVGDERGSKKGTKETFTPISLLAPTRPFRVPSPQQTIALSFHPQPSGSGAGGEGDTHKSSPGRGVGMA